MGERFSPEEERVGVAIAERRKCGAVVTVDGFHQVKLCCDPTLSIWIYPELDCHCLAEARAQIALRPPQALPARRHAERDRSKWLMKKRGQSRALNITNSADCLSSPNGTAALWTKSARPVASIIGDREWANDAVHGGVADYDANDLLRRIKIEVAE